MRCSTVMSKYLNCIRNSRLIVQTCLTTYAIDIFILVSIERGNLMNSNGEGRFLISFSDVRFLITTICISFQLPFKLILWERTELNIRIVQLLSRPEVTAVIVNNNSLCLRIWNACHIPKWKAITVSKGHITA
jgi:hypothetical protein